jgi:nicotinate-nucleotide pyrophosphorylase (carboxylating)
MVVTPSDFGATEQQAAERLVALALEEDLGTAGDITSMATIPASAQGAACLVARSPGVLAGLPVVERLVAEFQLSSGWRPNRCDGEALASGEVIARLAGPMRSLLALERTALNFVQRLSGIATLTSQFVVAVAGTHATIYDTRKTTPGWRALEKYAVRCGGGANHRFGLFDAVLIKDNHLAWLQAAAGPRGADPIRSALAAAVANVPAGTTIEIEVDSLEQLRHALPCGAEIILVDNLGSDEVAQAVRLRDALAPRVALEATGGVSLATVRALAQTGVDRISVGALTHSAPALDLAMDFDFQSIPDGLAVPAARPGSLGP